MRRRRLHNTLCHSRNAMAGGLLTVTEEMTAFCYLKGLSLISDRGKWQPFIAWRACLLYQTEDNDSSRTEENDSLLLPEGLVTYIRHRKMTAFCCLKEFSDIGKWQLFVAGRNSQNGKALYCLDGFSEREKLSAFLLLELEGILRKGKVTAFCSW